MSVSDEILKLKQLLDRGAITQEEFIELPDLRQRLRGWGFIGKVTIATSK